MSPQALEDEIFRLRRLAPESPVSAVLEEAAQALNDGREMEAEALVEKAAALLRS